jgi:hypothetical protein
MRYDESEINSLGELIEKLEVHVGGYQSPIWFRGQAQSSWSLEPKLMRLVPRPSETYYLNRFKQDASIILSHRPGSEFEWMFLMQHYGIPTRLLDWSESPLTALYFAINEFNSNPGALWILLPSELNKKSNYRPEYEFEIPSFEDEHMKGYLPSTISMEMKSKLFPMAAIAPRNSPRMQSQQGVFTICHRESIAIENVGAEGNPRDHVWKMLFRPLPKKSLSEN